MPSDVNYLDWVSGRKEVKVEEKRGFGPGSRSIGATTMNQPKTLLDDERDVDHDGSPWDLDARQSI